MTTASAIITQAAKKIGVAFKNEALAADEAADGLTALNNMLASWSNDSLLVYSRTWESFTLVSNTASYTIGVGGDFNTTRPIAIVEAHVKISSIDYPLEIIPDEVYNHFIQLKTIQTSPAQYLTYDNANPLGTIRLYPVPASNDTLFLLTEKPATALALTDTLSFPPGWERAIVYNLAIEMAPEYGNPTPPEVVALAAESKAEIKRASMRNKPMTYLPDTLTSNRITRIMSGNP
jgi:hypothetical protein